MSQTVDSRVVELRFDNGQFEENVRQSMSTLDRLKASLNMDGASKSFKEMERASNSVSFEGLYNNIELLTKRFSTFGIIGMRVVQNLTDSVMKFAHNTMNTVTNSIIGGGKRRAMNIENARFQLQGLLGDEEKVEAIMKDALDSVDGTAYAFDEAAKAASQFAATGMRAGEDMYGALRGITGVAAMTNSEYADIARIFTTVAGNGRMMGDQLLQLSSRGLNAAVTVKDYFNGVNNGTIEANDSVKEYIHSLTKGLEISEGELREFVSAGKVSFDVFAKAMDNAFGEHAKKANDTLTGSIANVKAALARIGAEFVSPLIVQKGPLVMFFNALREKVNEIKKNITPLANLFTDTVSSIATSATRYLKQLSFGNFFKDFNASVTSLHDFLNRHLFDRFGEFSRLIESAGAKMADFQEAAFEVLADSKKTIAKERWEKLGKEFQSYDNFISKYGSFQASLKTGWLTTDVFAKAINKLCGDLDPLAGAFKSVDDVLKEFDDISNQVIRGNFGNGATRVKELTEAGYDYATVQSVVNHKLLGWEIDLTKVSTKQLESIGYTKEQAETLKKLAEEAQTTGTSMEELLKSFARPTGAELFFGSLHNIVLSVTSVLGAFRDAWRETFVDTPTLPLYSFLEFFNKLTSRLVLNDENLVNLKNSFKGVLSVFELGRTVLRGFYDAISQVARAIDPSFNGFTTYLLRFTGYIGNAITNIVTFAKNSKLIDQFLVPVIERLKNIAKTLQDFYNTNLNTETFKNSISAILTEIKDFALNISDHFEGALEIFERFFKSIKELNGQFTLENVKKVIKDFADDVSSSFTNLGDTFQNTKDIIFGFVKTILKKFGVIGDKTEQIGEAIPEVIGNIAGALKKFNFGGLIAILGGVATIKFITNLYKLISAPKLGIAKSFRNILDQISGGIKEFRKSIKYENMLKLAIAVAIFAGSIKLLSTIDTKTLLIATGAIIVLAAALTGLNLLTGSIIKIGDKKGEVKKGTSSLLGLALAIGIIAYSLKQIEQLKDPWGTIGKAAAIAGGLVILVGVMESLNSGVDGKSTAFAVLGFAAGLYIVIMSLKKLEGLDLHAIEQRMPILIQLFIGLAGLMIASKFAGEHAQKAGAMMLMMAIAMKLMVGTIVALSLIPTKTLNKGIKAVAKILQIFMGVLVASKFAGENAHKAGVMFLAMSVSLLIMVGAMKLIGLLSDDELKRAMSVLRQITICFSILMIASKFTGREFKSIVALIIAVAALTIAIGALSFIPIDNLEAATKALATVMGMFALMTYATSKLQSAKTTVPNLLAMIGVIAALSYAIYELGSMEDPTAAIKSATAISELLLAMTLAMRIISNTKAFKADTLVNVGAMVIIIGILAIIVGLMADKIQNVDKVLPIAASLSLLILSLSAACLLLSMVGTTGNAAFIGIGALITLVGAVGLLAAACAALNEKLDGGLEKLVSDGIPILRSIGQALGEFVGGIVNGFLDASGLSNIGDSLISFMEQIKEFASIATNDIDPDLGTVISSIAGAILAFAGAEFIDAISNIVSKITGTTTLGPKLKELGEALVGFAEAVSGGEFSEQSVKDAGVLGQALANLNNSLPRTGGTLQQWIGWKDLDKFGENIAKLASGLHQFILILGNDDFDAEKMDGIAGVGQTLADLNNSLPPTGGTLQNWLGWKDLDKFGENIVKLASGLHQFILILGNDDFDKGKMDDIAGTGQMLADLNDSLPATGGTLQDWLGSSDLALFSTNLPKLASGLHQFILIVGTDKVDQGAIDAVMVVANMLAEFSSTVPTSGGLLDKLFGDDSLGGFAENIKALGEGINDFSHSMDDVSIESADKVQKMMSALTGAQTMEVANAGGLNALGTETSQFGSALEEFDKKLKGVDTGQMTSVLTAFEQFVSGLKGITQIDTSKVDEVLEAIQKLGSIDASSLSANMGAASSMMAQLAAQMMAIFSNSIVNSGGSITAAANGLMGNFVSAVSARIPVLSGVGAMLGSALVTAIATGTGTLPATMSSTMAAALLSVSMFILLFGATGTAISTSLNNGLTSSDFKKSLTSKISAAKDAARGYRSEFYNAGEHLVRGFANGISENTFMAEARAREMARKAADAAKRQLNERSPSKVFYQIGAYAGQGFINALYDYGIKSYEAGHDIAERARIGLTSSVKMISDIIQDGIDTQPTITPVLDLSEVAYGATQLDNMMTFNPALAVAGNASFINSAMNNNRYSATNDDVVSAIKDLNRRIKDLPHTTNNINGITYDDGSNINDAVRQLVRAARVERRA